jgi:ATP-dependent helicase/nuclease subunit B
MTSPILHFLGWTRPAVETVCDFLLSGARPGRPFDLEGSLLVVPTQQAGRHLLDALVQRCGASGVAVLSQRVVTPTHLAADALRRHDIASGAEILTAWSEVLLTAGEPLLTAAFGASGRLRDPAMAVSMAERLQQVRRELAEAARTCADVAAQADAAGAEQERWLALAQLESAVLVRLARDNLRDPCAAQIAWAADPQLAPEVRRVVVACVPDPSLLLVRALERLAGRIVIDVLVQAPPDEAACFDAWGRPLPDHWNIRRIDIPNEEENLLLAADPSAQASRIVAILAAETARTTAANQELPPLRLCASARESKLDQRPTANFTVSDVAIGVPDRATVPFLVDHLASCGVSAFDPQERPLREHPLCELIARLLDLRRAAPYRTVADLLRHPDVLTALRQGAPALDPAQLLTQLDEFQNLHLPLGLPDLLRPFAQNPRGTASARVDFTVLGQALQRVAQWRDRLVSERLPSVLRALLAEIYAGRELDPEVPADRLFSAVAEAVDCVLRELEDARLPPAAAEIETAVLTARIRSQGCAPERGDERIDLEGWLELPWNRAPLLFVAGMNEGFVPDGRLADDFLPDSLRRALGLRDDRLRAARDAFLLHVLLASRATGRGRVCLLCGKSSAEGDPLRPSRLLFRCDDAHLPQRARQLFRKLPAARPGAPATVGFRLQPFALACGGGGPPPAKEKLPSPVVESKPSISVTQFKDYLRCPFRFYLRHRLQMTPLADDPLAPDELAFGNFVHAVLQDFAGDQQLAHCSDAAKLAAGLAGLVRAKFAACYGPRPSLAVQVALESAVQRLGRFAALQAELAQEWEIVSTENRFVLTRGGCEIVARIDRIDRHRRDGRLRVMDYKTFEKIKTPAEMHFGSCRQDTPAYAQVDVPGDRGRIRRKAWQDLQLPLYREALIASGQYDAGRMELGYFILPRAIGETGFQPWSDYTTALHDSAMTCADGVLAAIAAGVFWPPRDVPPDWDDYASLFVGTPEQCFELSTAPICLNACRGGVVAAVSAAEPAARDTRAATLGPPSSARDTRAAPEAPQKIRTAKVGEAAP